MRIAYVASEVSPFAKTGGLADVAGSLPAALQQLGNEVAVFMPLYREVDARAWGLAELPTQLDLHHGHGTIRVRYAKGVLPGSEVPVYFVRNAHYFDRPGLYTENGKDYKDNLERYAFFCRAVLELMQALDWRPDVLHGNDWQTALALVYAKTLYRDVPTFARTRTLLTVHNLAYQGCFPKEQYWITGLDWSLFGIDGLEFFAQINLLKGGLMYADHINTVSKQYAKEIRTQEFGCGLDGVLRYRADDVSGILNGGDYTVWNPATDPQLVANYSVDELAGKAANKAALQQRMELDEDPDVPLIGMVSRLDRQKGFDLVLKAFERLVGLETQLVLLGTGAPRYEKAFDELAEEYPGVFGLRLAFDDELAHLIEAGADIFLMPSLYEPCGLNQLYSLRYGTVPVVRKTGGLADTVQNYSARTGKGNGFVFSKPLPGELVKAVRRAVELYREDPDAWLELMQVGMQLDFSWNASAKAYDQLYRRLRRGGTG